MYGTTEADLKIKNFIIIAMPHGMLNDNKTSELNVKPIVRQKISLNNKITKKCQAKKNVKENLVK